MASNNRHAQLSYTEMFTDDELIVEFDGNTYLLANSGNGEYGGGNSPTTTNPIGIAYANGVNTMYISNNLGAGVHNVVIKAESSSIETTECFKKAVRSVSVMMLRLIDNGPLSIDGATWKEAYNALTNGAMIYLYGYGNILPCTGWNEDIISFSLTYVNGDFVYTDMYIWQQDGSVTNNSTNYPPQQGN